MKTNVITELGIVVEIGKGTGFLGIHRKLRTAGSSAVKFHLCGLEVTHRRPGLGAGLLAQITKQVSVRCLVDKAGLTQIFPRPYCHLLAQGLVVNGQLFDPMYGPLDTFRVVWPELDTELGQRLGSFVCEES